MTCERYEDAILDVARGTEVNAATVEAVRAHADVCDACGSRLRREESLTAGLGALAKTLEGAEPSPALEERLLQAFDERFAAAHMAARSAERRVDWRVWAAAAAAVIMVSSVPFLRRPAVDPNVPQEAPAPAQTIAGAARPVSGAVVEQPATVAVGVPPSHVVPARKRAHRQAQTVVRPSGFVALPSATDLPQFESGTIQRVHLSLASLPGYGVDIAGNTGSSPVEADLLVGQDGQARAIRLVNISVESRSRQ
jgi:hypothetical protein